MQGFTMIDLIILVVYLAAVLFAGLHFAKKDMKGKEYFKGGRNGTLVGHLRINICNIIKSDFIFIPSRKFLCGNLDYVVCTAWHAFGNSYYHSVLPADLQ